MAYKFQLGEAQLSGALVQEGAIKVHNESGTEVANFSQAGIVSGSGQLQAASVDVDGAVDGKDGFKVNGTAIVDSARAVSNVTTIAMGGALSGVTTLAASGLASIASISMDDGSTLGPDSVPGLWTFSADGDTTQADGAYDFDIASHDGTNGLKLAGVLVDASAADLNFTNVAAAGTAEASKAVVLDASKDITGINQLTASYFSGNGSGITNINVENLDAVGSDTYVQFNQNGEFGAAAGFTFDGTGSVASSVMVSSADLKATNLTSGRVLVAGTSGLLEDNADLAYDGSTLQVKSKDGQGGSIYSQTGSIAVLNAAGNGYLAKLGNDGDISGSGNFETAGQVNAASSIYSGANIEAQGNLSASADLELAGASRITAPGVSLNNADLLQIDGITAGTAAASKAVVLDASKNIATIGTVGCGAITSTGASSFGSVSGSSNFSIGGTLSADNLASVTVDLTADMMVIDDGASGAIKITSLASYATALAAGANEGLASTAGRLELDLSDLTAADVSVANDSIAIVDANDSNATRKESIADLVSAMAGAGLAASSGVLSTQAQSVHTDFNAGVAIEEGYNVYTGSADVSVALPASAGLTAGDVFVVKQGASGDVTIAANGSDLIDGAASIMLESPYAAVSVLFTGVANTFRII